MQELEPGWWYGWFLQFTVEGEEVSAEKGGKERREKKMRRERGK